MSINATVEVESRVGRKTKAPVLGLSIGNIQPIPANTGCTGLAARRGESEGLSTGGQLVS
jgi:hypothetical protein